MLDPVLTKADYSASAPSVDQRAFMPGRALLRLPPLLAAVVMLVNLFYLKPRHPGWWSGKLSDFAICFFLPVVIVSAYEWLRFLVGRRRAAGKAVITAACLISAAYFSALQLFQVAADLHVAMLGMLVSGLRFAVTRDLTDLIALPMVAIAFLWLCRVQGVRCSPLGPAASNHTRAHAAPADHPASTSLGQ